MVKLTDMANDPALANRIWDAFDAYWCAPQDDKDYEDDDDNYTQDDIDRAIDDAYDTFGTDPLFDGYDY